MLDVKGQLCLPQHLLLCKIFFFSDVCSPEAACFFSLSLMLCSVREVALFIIQAGTLLIVKVRTTANYAGTTGINRD